MSRLAVVAVALLAVTAGCNAIADDDPEQATVDETATVTPAPVPTEQPFAGTDGVPDIETLATGHATTLSRTNYTVVIRERVTAGNRTVRLDTRRREVGRNAERYRLRRERTTRGLDANAVAPVVSYWYNGSLAVARTDANGSTVRRYPDTTTGPLSTPSDRDYIERLARAFALVRADEAGVVLTSTRLAAPEFAPSTPFVGRPENGSVTLRVTSGGYVSSYRYAFEGTAPGVAETVRVVREVRFENVSQTRVQPPEWVVQTSERDPDGLDG